MSKNLNKLIKKNIDLLFENMEQFDDMTVAFGVKHKSDNLTDAEKAQFGKMETVEELLGDTTQEDVPNKSSLKKVTKDNGEESKKYYKEVAKKMEDYQKPESNEKQSKIGEAIEPKKFNPKKEDIPMGEKAPTGTGMEGLRYDNEDTEVYDEFEERNDELNSGDEEGTTYGDMKKAGEKYKNYKYGDKYKEVENEYQETPRVRTTTKESVKYSDVVTENIFKTKNTIVSEEQVIKSTKKLPNRIKVDETVFSITDGENFYRLVWEGDEKDGKAIITHNKNTKIVSEGIQKMKHLWDFKASDVNSTKKTVSEGNDDVFKKMMDITRGKNK